MEKLNKLTIAMELLKLAMLSKNENDLLIALENVVEFLKRGNEQ